MTLTVCEIFYSIQGETRDAGFPSVFVRCAGCNLNCAWCDTRHAREGGAAMTIDEVLTEAARRPAAHHLTLTGGEPLIQQASVTFVREAIRRGWRVQVETNGSILIRDVPEEARRIVDVKTPSSGEADSFEARNLRYLTAADELKFVIQDEADYVFAKDFCARYCAKIPATVNFSPAAGGMRPADLAERILRDSLPVRLNLQLHALLWGAGARGR